MRLGRCLVRVVGVGDQRLAEREVEVDRARVPVPEPARDGQRPADERAPVRVLAGTAFRHADLVEHPYRVAVQLHLVGGLVGADTAQLRRPVGGEHDERHAGMVGLEHGRVQVGGGSTRRTHHRDRAAARLGQPEREETGRPFVDAYVQADVAAAIGTMEGERERSVARPRRQHRLADPAAPHLVDEHAGECGGGVHTSASTPASRSSQRVWVAASAATAAS